jgi:hypothetical protein
MVMGRAMGEVGMGRVEPRVMVHKATELRAMELKATALKATELRAMALKAMALKATVLKPVVRTKTRTPTAMVGKAAERGTSRGGSPSSSPYLHLRKILSKAPAGKERRRIVMRRAVRSACGGLLCR